MSPHASELLNARAIRRACGGHADVFDYLCELFRQTLPDHTSRIQSARRDRDLRGLRAGAHMLSGTVGAFSSVAGDLALALEDAAIRADLDTCERVVDQLDSVCVELLEVTRALTFDDLVC